MADENYTKDFFRQGIERTLKLQYSKTIETSSIEQIFFPIARTLM